MTHPRVTGDPKWLAEIKNNEYWNRPFMVRYESSEHSGTHMFETEAGAYEYLFYQAKRISKLIRDKTYGQTWVALNLYRTHIAGPDGQIHRAREILFLEKLATH